MGRAAVASWPTAYAASREPLNSIRPGRLQCFGEASLSRGTRVRREGAALANRASGEMAWGNPGPDTLAHANPWDRNRMSESPATPRSANLPAPERMRIIRWVALGVIAWGIFHAIGAWRFNNNPLRAVVVLACVGAFLGFWMAMLAVRQRRLSKH